MNLDALHGLICPYCHSRLFQQEEFLFCQSCKKQYPIVNGIPNFCQKDEYWCNVSREKMQELNRKAVESGDWLEAARELIPDYLDAIEPFDRADAQFLWPTTLKSRVLDAGSMWGGLTIPVAQHCGEIFAVDKTIETLMFLKIRAGQMGFNNIHIAASTAKNLPFPDSYFDLVIMNGVLEWVALEQDVVLEVHWGKKRNDSATYAKDPRQMQVEVLAEIRRVLKPGGHLYLAIENRIGYPYLLGTPDDHMNIKYVSFLPRALANAVTKWKLNCEYRTYVYGLPGLRSLLKDGGFRDMEFYGVFPHYICPTEIIPINMVRYWKKTLLPLDSPTAPFYLKMAARILPGGLLKYLSPSFVVLAGTPGGEHKVEARIIQLLRKAGLLQGTAPSDIRAAKCNGRSGNYHPANFLIYDKNDLKPAYFCKICRNNKYTDILENEANNLKVVNNLLKNTELNSSIPRLLYFGTIDNITFLVTQFVEGKPSEFKPSLGFTKNNLRKLDESIQLGIRFLVKFQKYTQVREVEAAPHLLSVLKKQREILNNKGQLTEDVDSHIEKLTEEIKILKGLSVPICAIHGDYDFYYNILFNKNEVRTVDYEHFEREGLPFFDLATLIFNPILMIYNNLKVNIPLLSFIEKNNLKSYIHKWLHLYAELSGTCTVALQFFAQVAALEQQTRQYPYYRNPRTYPMHSEKAFIALLSLKVAL